MEQINIRVRGSHTTSVPAERGTVNVQISLEGDHLAGVMSAVTIGQQQLVSLIEALHDKRSGPVTWYAIDQLGTRSWTPTDRDNRLLPERHRAWISAQVKFSDFAAIPAWVQGAVGINGFRVEWVDWALTAKHRESIESKTRQRAVRDARTRAQNYADALDLGEVRIRAISDAGLGFALPAGGGRETVSMDIMVGGAAEARGELVPLNIEVTAQVDAEFVVAP